MTRRKWEKHYTGISIYELGPVYLQRDTKTKVLQFARLSCGRYWWVRKLNKRIGASFALGLFLGRTNHMNQNGCELFASVCGLSVHAGRTTELQKRGLRFSGSAVEPYSTFTVVFGRWFAGGNSPAWLVRKQERKAQAYWEGVAEAHENAMREQMGEQGYADYMAWCEQQQQDDEANYTDHKGA